MHPFTPIAMATEDNNQDFTLTYPDVERILNRSRRSVQTLVSEGRLTKRMSPTPTGERAYFSESEVKKLSREIGVNGKGEKPEKQLARYEGGFGMLAPQVQRMQELIDTQTRQIQELATEKGELKGRLTEVEKLLKAKDEELKKHTGRSDQLRQEKAQLETEKVKLEAALDHERYKARLSRAAYIALALLVITVFVIMISISPLTSDLIGQFINGLFTR